MTADILTWQCLVDEWCFGIVPAVGQQETERALRALALHWPDYLNRLLTSGARGIVVILPAIKLGWILERCASLQGFAPVFARLKRGEASAHSELALAADLVDIGFTPELEPLLAGKRPDLKVPLCETSIYVEVINPTDSIQIRANRDFIGELSNRILESSEAEVTEVLLTRTLTEAESCELIDTIKCAKPSHKIRRTINATFVKESLMPNSPNPTTPRLPGAIGNMLSARAKTFGRQRTMVTVGIPMVSDQRVHRLLSAEMHHLSRAENNIIAVKTSDAGGNAIWRALTQKWFQPTRNRRVSAILIADSTADTNPTAMRPVMGSSH